MIELGIIVAVSPEGVIGRDNRIPWHYPADLKRFKALTEGTTVIMGRHTYDSIGKPLAKRRNIVVTSTPIEGVECFRSLGEALSACMGEVWCIGGARLYAEALAKAQVIDMTLVPDRPPVEGSVLFPDVPEEHFAAGVDEPFPGDERLRHRVYRRR